VAVVHWKYSGASGEYSDHTKTVIYDTGGSVLPTTNVSGETGYRVKLGQTVRAEFTYENNGANTQTGIQVGYYISTNDLITTFDRKIGSASFNLSRDNVFTTTVNLVIPNDLSSGTNYWLGVIIDDNGAIRESVETNNATYIPIHVD
jgi:subtilase family serine protease